jgi:hypothetical protein
MTLPRQQVPWVVWPLWVTASAVGSGLGAVAYDWYQRTSRDGPSVPILITAGLVVLTLPAILQWLVLRHWVPRAGWWIVASAVGNALSYFPIGWGINRLYPSPYASTVAVVAAFLLSGAVSGAMEWLVLRRRVWRAGWWVLARSIGSCGAMAVVAVVTKGADVRFFLGGLTSGAASGVVAGLALAWLLRNPQKSSS